MAAPFIGYCILHDQHAWALGLFAYAGITDLLDGWIARKWNQGTVVGTVIDPMADKILMTVLTVALAMKGALPSEYSVFLTRIGPWFWQYSHTVGALFWIQLQSRTSYASINGLYTG